MPFLELFDETLDINSTENYELSVQAGSDELAFSILDTIRNKYVLLRSFEAEENNQFTASAITEIISKDDFLTKRYRKTNIIMPSRKFTLVPAQLFDPGKRDEYYLYNHVPEEGTVILSNRSSDPDVFIIFSAVMTLYESVTEKFPGIMPWHHSKPLLNYVSRSRKSTEGDHIQLHIEKDFFNLIIYRQNILKFCNSFTYRNINDILYYVLNTFRNLEIKQEETIWLSGHTEKYDDLTSAFAMYIRHLKFSEPTGNFTFSYVFNETVLHRYLNLFTLVNCE
ncbi:MAG: DUF3822 family protein [Bacteroidetes bacterium]|nr:DUF3822 family protein [Bacteroidota bacterium]